MKKQECSIKKYYKEVNGKKKTYLKCKIVDENKRTFEFCIKPMFLSNRAYATLMNMVKDDEK